MRVAVYIEIAKGTNQKYEFDPYVNNLVLDRVLPHPFFYPFSYGFCPNTLSDDGDELDVLVISHHSYPPRTFMYGHIVGALLMEDEKGNDTKILVVPVDETHLEIQQADLDAVCSFFESYKKDDPARWARVHGLIEREEAVEFYVKAVEQYLIRCKTNP